MLPYWQAWGRSIKAYGSKIIINRGTTPSFTEPKNLRCSSYPNITYLPGRSSSSPTTRILATKTPGIELVSHWGWILHALSYGSAIIWKHDLETFWYPVPSLLKTPTSQRSSQGTSSARGSKLFYSGLKWTETCSAPWYSYHPSMAPCHSMSFKQWWR